MALTTYAKVFGLFIVLFLTAGKCSVAPPAQQQSQQTANTANTNNLPKLKRHDTIFQQSKINWVYWEQIPPPIEVKDIKLVKSGLDKGDLQIEMLNISDKPIVAAKLSFEVPECISFALEGLSIDIDWGDVSLIGKPVNAEIKTENPKLNPGETAVATLNGKRIKHILRPENYKRCKPERNYSYIGPHNFRFEDGTEWRLKDIVKNYSR